MTRSGGPFGWRSGGDALRELMLGALVGILILLIEEGAKDNLPHWKSLLRNSVLGSFILAGSRGLETALSWALEQSRIPTTFRTLIYAVGGWLGYFGGVMVAWTLFGKEERDLDLSGFHFFYAIGLTAVLSILIGLILHHNRKRNDRLRASIERLKEHEFAEKELQIARAMQQRLLPPADIEADGYRITARTEGAHIVAGDFYDVIHLEDDAVAVLAADVSGKGMAASLLMASCKAAVPFLASTGGAAQVMTTLNRTLCDQLQRREFVAMVFCRYHPSTGALQVVNAGMPDPLLHTPGGRVQALVFSGDRLPLGAMRNTRYEETSLTLEPGQRLYLFSDGLPEAKGADGPIGYDRVEALIAEGPAADAIVERLRGSGEVQIDDDLTLVVLERRH